MIPEDRYPEVAKAIETAMEGKTPDGIPFEHDAKVFIAALNACERIVRDDDGRPMLADTSIRSQDDATGEFIPANPVPAPPMPNPEPAAPAPLSGGAVTEAPPPPPLDPPPAPPTPPAPANF